ncbi:hypothetical protein M9H77_14248 [Catharanthus roseus]|uniref:Uncharacterized protein n=1 Tax=Catharanthus roseus TaxID=4058 RepID=A0ACC0BMS6_CATRO|nr:hypothetical protein M9H77_14248 [Catharanthus roseus]
MGCAMRYNMPLLEAVWMTPTGKNFIVAIAFIRNEQATTYGWGKRFNACCDREVFSRAYHMLYGRHIDQNVLAKLTEMIKDEEVALRSIADIKISLEYSRLKEKFNAKSNLVLKNLSNNNSHLALKKVWVEIMRAPKIIDDLKNKCGHYLRTSHGLPCSCELITRFDHILPIQLDDIETFCKTLEIGGDHPCLQEKGMDSKMHNLASLFDQISTGPISKVREMRRLAKGVISPVLPEETLISPPEVTVTKGRRKMNLTKKDKSYWEHVSIAHRKIQKSSNFGLSFGSRSGSGSGSGSHGRGRPPRAPIATHARWMPIAPLHVQWEYHCSDRVNGWAETYSDRIANWNTSYARAHPPGDPIHVNL